MKTNQTQKNIFNGWKILSFRELDISVIDGDRGINYPNQNDFSVEGYCLFLNAGNVTREGFRFSDVSFITKQKDEDMGKGKLNNDDLVITTRGTIGNIAHYSEDITYKNIRINSGMAIIRNSKQKIGTNFLLQYFNSLLFNQELKRVAFGSAQPQLTIQIINKFKIKIPEDKPEQNRIISVLETWDKSIENLNKKIEIKKQIKLGLMQDLLTGKKRLSGFKDEWQTMEIGELLDYEQPNKYIVKSTDYDDIHKTPVLTANKAFILGYTDEIEGIYKSHPVIIFDDFTMDNKFVNFDFKVKSSAIKILTPKNKDVNLKFVFERIQLINVIIGQHRRHYLSEYQYITIDTPDIKEQNAIANILTTADKEITELEKKLSIIKDQKKYLLNNLITGAIRTPETLSTKF